MNIATREEEGVVILDLVGKLVIGDGDVQLREEVKDRLDRGAKKLLLNLKGVKTMDSSGLGELIRTKASANAAGTTIKLLHVESKVQEVLEMTRLIGVFDSFNDEIDALASFRD
ncbi:MAG: STAS domain-containing protein [Acidobacteriota bacterium]